MQVVDRDWLVRQYAFRFLEDLVAGHGDPLPWKVLDDGFEFDGARVTLIGARGIWKPAALELPISMTTSPKDPVRRQGRRRRVAAVPLLQHRPVAS